MFSSVISLLQKRDSFLKCYFSSNIWAPSKNLCWCCSLCGVHVVFAPILCVPVDIMETQEDPGNQAETTETSRNNRNKQKTQERGNQAETTETSRKPRKIQETRQEQQKQAENPGKSRKTQEPSRKKTAIRLRVLSTNKAFFASRPTPLPPPGALSRNGGALSLNNVFPARLFGKHGWKTLSLNSLLSAENLENHFQVAPKLQKQ